TLRQEKAKTEETLYFQRITLAHRELLADNLGRAKDLLDECPDDRRQWEWHYLKRLGRVEPMILPGSAKGVYDVAFSPDGRRLASGGEDRSSIISDVTSGQELFRFSGHAGLASSVAFSPDGLLLASGNFGGAPKVWDAQTGHPVHTLAGAHDG